MGTRATIRFKDGDIEVFVYRGHDGFPANVLPDLQKVIEKKKNSWSGPDCQLLATCFLGEMYENHQRLPDYELTGGFHGDESYKYYVTYSNDLKNWVITCE